MNEQRATNVAIGLAVTAALVRLIPLQWLHPLNWDELEFYRATRWIAEGRMPFRDFWEHHAPLPWFLFAPFARLTDSPGVDAILLMRWAQIPVWIATFVLANAFMRNAELSRFARWSAMALAVSSSFLMTSAVEYRVDPLATALLMGGLVAWQRGTKHAMFLAGALFCLSALANLRLGPLLVATVILLCVVDRRARAWRIDPHWTRIFAGGLGTLGVVLFFFAAINALDAIIRQLIYDNYVGEKLAIGVEAAFLHRLLTPFGVRIIAGGQFFELASLDVGGVLLLLGGFTGLVIALLAWRNPSDLFVMALLQIANLLFVARMKFVYNYHFQTVIVMMLPLVALIIDRIPRRAVVVAFLGAAWAVNGFASIFRGKELDLAYQDRIMREVHARTRAEDRVWSGIPWALRREPAYPIWFLPSLVQNLVRLGETPRYELRSVVADPPGAVIADRYALLWMTTVQKELRPYFVRHYLPVWRHLWVPAMNVRLTSRERRFQWVVPRDGTYRLITSGVLAKHQWFFRPVFISSADDVGQIEATLPEPAPNPALRFFVDGKPASFGARVLLRKGQRVGVAYGGNEPLAVLLVPGEERTFFRTPPVGVSIDLAAPRVTHVPDLSP